MLSGKFCLNLDLDKQFTGEEVLKTPGPNGMSSIFYKTFWHIVDSDVTEAVLTALNTSHVPAILNSTFIALIPIIKEPKKVSDFKAISLCNVVYKLIAKVLVNHLKLILPYIVSDSQSAFLLGHLITNNILVAFETLLSVFRPLKTTIGLT